MKIIRVIVFLTLFSLFQMILAFYLVTYVGSAYGRIADIILGLAFWLTLWRLSAGSYPNGRGPARWVRPSGLFKALFIVSISTALGVGALSLYFDKVVMPPIRELGNLSLAIDFFQADYGVYPGKPGAVTPSIIEELKGAPDAKINTKRINYLKMAKVTTTRDRYGSPFYFRVDTDASKKAAIAQVVVISCGPNRKFENGAGDDMSFPDRRR